jgi:hypothetical protein
MKRLSRGLSALLVFVLLVAQAIPAAYAKESGIDHDSEWTAISTAAQLAGLTLKNTTVKYYLANDIDLTEVDYGNWTPVGTSSDPFQGTFDGNGHTISGLKFNDSSYAGLFGYVSGATIENLTISGSTVTSTSNYAGAVAAYASGSTKILNCRVEDTTVKSGGFAAGGIVGYLTVGSGSTTTISQCAVKGGTITSGSNSAGGIVGYIPINGTTNISESFCDEKTSVTAKTGAAGGIVGYTKGVTVISNCYNLASVTAQSADSTYYGAAGGIIGWTYNSGSKVNTSYNLGTVTGAPAESKVYSYAGGICGYNIALTSTSAYNGGTVTSANTNSNTNYKNYAKNGTLYGSSSGTLTSCYYLAGCLATGNFSNVTNGNSRDNNTAMVTSIEGVFDDEIWEFHGGETYPTLRNTPVVVEPDHTHVLLNDGEWYSDETDHWQVCIVEDCPEDTILNKAAHDYDGDTCKTCKRTHNHISSGKYAYDKEGHWFTCAVDNGKVDYEAHTIVNGVCACGYVVIPDGYTGIYNLSDLQNISKNLSGKYFLACDIDATGEDFTPITGFTGVFDGNGHTISNLTINTTSNNAGLFATVSGGTVKNLTIENGEIKTTGAYAGAIAGYVSGSATISDCHVVNTTVQSGTYGAGGLVGGMNAGYGKTAYVTLCSVKESAITSTTYGAGGIVGCVLQDGTVAISESFCNGDTTVIAKTGAAGGLVGYAKGATTVENCYNLASVTAKSADSTYFGAAGGIIGWAYNSGCSVKNTYNRGTVTCASSSTIATYAGGISGYNVGLTATQAFNSGTVAAASGSNKASIGTIFGYSDSNITTCYYLTGCLASGASATKTNGNVRADDAAMVSAMKDIAAFDTDVWQFYTSATTYPTLKRNPQTAEVVHEHSYGSWTDDENGTTHSRICVDNDDTQTVGHSFSYTNLNNDQHTVSCSVCDFSTTADHNFDSNGVCTDCKTEKHEHSFDENAWEHDSTGHWHVCTTGDGGTSEKQEHTLDNCTKLDDNRHTVSCVCGYSVTEEHSYVNGVCACGATQYIVTFAAGTLPKNMSNVTVPAAVTVKGDENGATFTLTDEQVASYRYTAGSWYYTFGHWVDEDGNVYTVGEETSIEGNVVLTPVWELYSVNGDTTWNIDDALTVMQYVQDKTNNPLTAEQIALINKVTSSSDPLGYNIDTALAIMQKVQNQELKSITVPYDSEEDNSDFGEGGGEDD